MVAPLSNLQLAGGHYSGCEVHHESRWHPGWSGHRYRVGTEKPGAPSGRRPGSSTAHVYHAEAYHVVLQSHSGIIAGYSKVGAVSHRDESSPSGLSLANCHLHGSLSHDHTQPIGAIYQGCRRQFVGDDYLWIGFDSAALESVYIARQVRYSVRFDPINVRVDQDICRVARVGLSEPKGGKDHGDKLLQPLGINNNTVYVYLWYQVTPLSALGDADDSRASNNLHWAVGGWRSDQVPTMIL